MAVVTLTQNDTYPVLQAVLTVAGVALDLTGATVTFRMETDAGATVVNEAACTIVNPATSGTVQYAWQAADTVTAGSYLGEFHVTLSGGAKITIPTPAAFSILIRPKLV